MLSIHSAFCLASDGMNVLRCSFRGRLRREKAEVYAGDLVSVEGRDHEYVIEKVLPRKNLLQRPSVANVDQVVVVTAMTKPPIDLVYLDRLLVQLESLEVEAAVCVNKIDAEDGEEVRRIVDVYRKAGYPAVATSALSGDGLPDLVSVMRGKTVVLAGASGVGKSKLLSALVKKDIETGSLSKIERGRHTTKGVTLYPVGERSYLADTPGFSRLDVISCEPHKLAYYYREMASLVPGCYYPRCLHRTEDDCEVRKAVSDGRITPERYGTYLALLAECQEKEKHKYE